VCSSDLKGEPPRVDHSLQDPRCVFQILKRHFRRYTPEAVERICGIPRESFLEVAESLCENSGRERTSAFVYSVGWTQHTVGVQYIRTAAIIQLLLGNIGRPGGGIMALRGHASIQGSTDIPTLFDILPGYLPMPHSQAYQDLAEYIEKTSAPTGYWGHAREYMVSLLKAYWGDADRGERLRLRLDPAADRGPLHLPDGDGHVRGEVPGNVPLRREPGSGLGELAPAPPGHVQPGVAGRA